ncbi:proton-conducting transporter membrane subunit [Suttonella ornithocola]|uniref:Multiple resistance and pH homeostasis protein D n=1 Tax=Suttonella ornithocola TaxID=279832 RepID=A0A380MPH0_9GAMM|nr:proton-conducting transporter membrane subunit [Suttonella ornithocola]SUO94510.1 Multiple resistance and pH homeostasis protein D [Suttonella ornithocola]
MLINWLPALPVVLPLFVAAILVVCYQHPRVQAWIAGIAGGMFFVIAVVIFHYVLQGAVLTSSFGGWSAPFGVVFSIDRLSAIMLLVTAIMTLLTLLYGLSSIDSGSRHPLTLPLMFGLITGVQGAFITADIFNWYVWFEVMLICSLGLLAIGRRGAQLDAAFKYLALNIFGTLLMLFAVAMIYGATGQLNFAALRASYAMWSESTRIWLLSLLALGFLVKSGAFPVFAWLPASYHTLPAPLLALFAALLTKVGIYAILRSYGDIFIPTPEILLSALGWLAVATMLFGVLGATYHWDMRRIFGFLIISTVGNILLAVALGSANGNIAAIFYMLQDILVKANLFFMAGLIASLAGSYDLRQIGGLYNTAPWLAILFAIPALSMIGIPPFSGFWAKILVLQESIAQGRVIWAAAIIVVSVLTMYAMMKIWFGAFAKPHPSVDKQIWYPNAIKGQSFAVLSIVILAALTLYISFVPQRLYQYVSSSVEQMEHGQ